MSAREGEARYYLAKRDARDQDDALLYELQRIAEALEDAAWRSTYNAALTGLLANTSLEWDGRRDVIDAAARYADQSVYVDPLATLRPPKGSDDAK